MASIISDQMPHHHAHTIRKVISPETKRPQKEQKQNKLLSHTQCRSEVLRHEAD
jgi:hypothetical protein